MTIKNFNIKDFKELTTDYWNDDFMMVSCTNYFPSKDETVRLNFFLLIICMEGRLQLEVNDETYLLQTGEMLFCLPTAHLSNAMFSPKREIRLIGFSSLPYTLENVGNVVSSICKLPVCSNAGEKERPNLCRYDELIMEKIREPFHPYKKEILQSLFSALFYELLAVFKCYAEETGNIKEKKRDQYLFKHFIKEVAKDNGMHRSVSYYADILCYSAKHMSNAIKRASGRTASAWINDYVIKQIAYQLKYTEKAMKEIASDFNFPNQSFFGKYVKSHLGMSPICYRNTLE